jgi:hypothetical protein
VLPLKWLATLQQLQLTQCRMQLKLSKAQLRVLLTAQLTWLMTRLLLLKKLLLLPRLPPLLKKLPLLLLLWKKPLLKLLPLMLPLLPLRKQPLLLLP